MTAATLDLVGSPTPRVHTPYAPGPSLGADVADLAEAIGLPLMPWQRTAIDAAATLTPDGAGWAHSTVAVAVARQNGKTHLARLRILAGLFLWGERLIVATAQNRDIALETFRAVVETIDAHPWLSAEVAAVRRANGQECVELRNGARYTLKAPTPGGARGLAAVDLVLMDEAREQRTEAAYSAFAYTQQAARSPQLWLTSNAGDDLSIVWNRLRSAALAQTEPGPLCWLEWSAPEGCALDDPAAWCDANPALGHTLGPATLAARVATDPPDTVRTEMLCQHVAALSAPWPDGRWTACHRPDLPDELPTGGAVVVDLSPERDHAAVVYVARVGPSAQETTPPAVGAPTDPLSSEHMGGWLLDVFETGPGGAVDTDAVARAATDALDRLDARWFGYDRYTGGAVADRVAVEWHGPPEDVSGRRFASACDDLLAALVAGTLAHPGQPEMTRAMMSAVRRPAGDGGWRIGRQASGEPVTAACALAIGVHLVAAVKAAPAFRFVS